MKKCNSCKSDLNDCAKRCHVCGAFQNWRRFMNLSNSVLSIMLALITVIFVAGPPFLDRFEGFHKKVQAAVSITNIENDSVVVFFQNQGKGYIAIGGAEINLLNDTLIRLYPTRSFIIEPFSAKILVFKTKEQQIDCLPVFSYNWQQENDRKAFDLKVYYQGTDAKWYNSLNTVK